MLFFLVLIPAIIANGISSASSSTPSAVVCVLRQRTLSDVFRGPLDQWQRLYLESVLPSVAVNAPGFDVENFTTRELNISLSGVSGIASDQYNVATGHNCSLFLLPASRQVAAMWAPLVAVAFLPLVVVTDDVYNNDASARSDVIADLMVFLKWRDVIFIYDDSLSAAQRQLLLATLADSHVGTVTLHLTTSRDDVISSLAAALENITITSVILCVDSTTAVRFLEEIKEADMLYHKGYEWLVLCAGSELQTIQDLLCCEPSNVATVVPVRALVPFEQHIAEEGKRPHTDSQDCLSLSITADVLSRLRFGIENVLTLHQIAPNTNASFEKGDTGKNRTFSQLSGPQLNIFCVCSYNYRTKALERVASWTPKTGLSIDGDFVFPNVFKDFNNATLRIGVAESEPFLTRMVNNGTVTYTGFCVEILVEMARYLNFSYELVEPPDGLFGAPDVNNTWNGMMGMLMRGELELAIGPFSITPERQAVVDFTVPYMEDGGGILTKGGERRPDLLNVFRPFPSMVWAILAAAVVVTAVVLFWIIKLSSYGFFSCGGDHHQQHRQQAWPLDECLMIIYGSLVCQGAPRHPVSNAGRLVLGCWWLFTILIVSIYTASLAALLTVRLKEHNVESIHELAESSLDPITQEGTNWWTLFMKAEKGVYKVIGDKMKVIPMAKSAEDALERIHDEPAAYIMDMNQVNYMYGLDCKNLHMASTIFSSNGLGFALPKRAYYKDALSRIILKLQEGGFMETWKRRWWRKSPECDTDTPSVSPSRRLEVVSIGGILISYGLVIVLSTICLAAEWIRHWLRCRGSREKDSSLTCTDMCSSCDADGGSEMGADGGPPPTVPASSFGGGLRDDCLVWIASLSDKEDVFEESQATASAFQSTHF